jgi:hypothetical protein
MGFVGAEHYVSEPLGIEVDHDPQQDPDHLPGAVRQIRDQRPWRVRSRRLPPRSVPGGVGDRRRTRCRPRHRHLPAGPQHPACPRNHPGLGSGGGRLNVRWAAVWRQAQCEARLSRRGTREVPPYSPISGPPGCPRLPCHRSDASRRWDALARHGAAGRGAGASLDGRPCSPSGPRNSTLAWCAECYRRRILGGRGRYSV